MQLLCLLFNSRHFDSELVAQNDHEACLDVGFGYKNIRQAVTVILISYPKQEKWAVRKKIGGNQLDLRCSAIYAYAPTAVLVYSGPHLTILLHENGVKPDMLEVSSTASNKLFFTRTGDPE